MTIDYTAAIEADGAALIAACAMAPGAAIVACPGWTTEMLTEHIAEVHDSWAFTVNGPVLTFEEMLAFWQSDRSIPDPSTARAALLQALRVVDDAPCWTWSKDHNVGFVRRFQASEALIHRVDAELAAGIAIVIEPAAAVDTIGVFLTYMMGDVNEGAPEVGGSVHIHCTDCEGEWLIDSAGDVTIGHQKGDAAIRGKAQDIVLALWRRGSLDACDVVGDADVARRFVAHCSLE